MKKKTTVNIDQYMARKIPYERVYEEEGLIEIKNHVFTKSYEIEEINPDSTSEYDKTVIRKQIELLLQSFPDDVTFQFTIYNNLIPQEAFLSKVLVPLEKEEKLNECIQYYNETIVDNVEIGHNNVKKNNYLTLSLKADIPEEAIERFHTIESVIKKNFANIYGIQIRALSTIERLKILYTMLNPGKNEFGKKADMDNSGQFTFEKMKYMKMSTKDILAPDSFDSREALKDHMILNNSAFTRTFFLCSVPKVVSDNLIADLTNISSKMICSIYYDSMSSEYGLEVSTENIKKNTTITRTLNRSTVKDRKNKTTIENRARIENNEDAYFNESAQQVFKQAVANGYNTMLCSFIIVLYANDLEELERDSKLLKLSVTKFACHIKCFDLQQLQGFQSALPLANCRVDVKITLDIPKLAIMSPLNIQDAFKNDGLFNGLNAINDNLVLINRKNNTNSNGMIAGVEFSGKTYQCKREIFNSLISTKDKVIVITTTPGDYDSYINRLGGNIITEQDINIFRMVEHYGIMEESRIFKSYFLEALIVAAHDYSRSLSKEEVQIKIEQLEKEVFQLLQHIENTKDQNKHSILQYLENNADTYYEIVSGIKKLNNKYWDSNNPDPSFSNGLERLIVYSADTASDIIILLDHIWNEVIEDKKKGISTWIFIDSIDPLLRYSQAADYVIEYLEKCSQMKTIFTMVIQSTIKLISEDHTLILFEELVNNLGYFKLLNQGPLERKKYAELLNIPNSLINYITNVEPSEGLILTSASNIAFDDSFVEDENDPFYSLFSKQIEQYRAYT